MSRSLFDPETIERLARLLHDGGLTELDIHDDKARLRLVRAAPAPAMAAAPPLAAAAAAPTAALPPSEALPPEGAVKSPMVGIVYLAPEPGAASFVTLGQAVIAGQTLLLIEAMKTFNQIKAPHAGTVTQILVQPGAPVEYDQPLMVIA